ncbi:MAG: phosphate ABC transporter substrate-binding protein [Defluviitaleaceae bacterium]|nr:phosphate ABC transporter substrate-binding protein [Defluviitaleaceae bacterium]
MKKIIAIVVSLLLMTACGGGSASGGKVDISGSTSVLPYMEMLAAEYMAKTGKIIEVGGGGSSAGITNARSGVSDIGMSSRNLSADENAALTVYEIARDGLAIIVHPDNPVTNLTIEQIRDIYAERITDWAQIGGSNGSITLVTRESGSGTRDAFEEMVMGGRDGDNISDRATVQNNNGVIRATVSGSKNAIGYVSLGVTIGDSSVKAAAIDGVVASLENIRNDEYKLFRSFYIVTSPDDVSDETKAFIDYILSDGQDVLEEEGLVRVVG